MSAGTALRIPAYILPGAETAARIPAYILPGAETAARIPAYILPGAGTLSRIPACVQYAGYAFASAACAAARRATGTRNGEQLT
jgi:hypothetical protein